MRRVVAPFIVLVSWACGSDPSPSPDAGSPSDAGESCTPGARTCDAGGNVVECNAGGSASTLVATCEAGCENGACTTCLCSPGEARCEGRDLLVCAGEGDCGTSFSVVATCELGCDAVTKACGPPPCDPNARRCGADGTSIEFCDETLGWTSRSCGPGGRCVVDSFGAVAEPKCVSCPVESGRVCRGPDIVEVDGCDEFVVEACDIGCERVDGTPTCIPPICAPNARRCAGATLERCSNLGSEWAFEATCGDGCVTTGEDTAECRQCSCTTGNRRCGVDSGTGDSFVEECTCEAFERVETCADQCASGACVQ